MISCFDCFTTKYRRLFLHYSCARSRERTANRYHRSASRANCFSFPVNRIHGWFRDWRDECVRQWNGQLILINKYTSYALGSGHGKVRITRHSRRLGFRRLIRGGSISARCPQFASFQPSGHVPRVYYLHFIPILRTFISAHIIRSSFNFLNHFSNQLHRRGYLKFYGKFDILYIDGACVYLRWRFVWIKSALIKMVHI